MTLLNGNDTSAEGGGIYKKAELAGWHHAQGLYAQSGADQYDFAVFVKKEPGVSDADAQAAISRSCSRPERRGPRAGRSTSTTSGPASTTSAGPSNGKLLVLAVLIGALGTANT